MFEERIQRFFHTIKITVEQCNNKLRRVMEHPFYGFKHIPDGSFGQTKFLDDRIYPHPNYVIHKFKKIYD